jgi:hypothetical protein
MIFHRFPALNNVFVLTVFARAGWRYIVTSRKNNTLKVCTALMTQFKILNVFGFIVLVRPYSLILDSFPTNKSTKVAFYLSDFSNKMAPSK